MTDPIALAEPTFGEEEVEAVRACLQSGWVAGQGPRGAELEAAVAETTGAQRVVAVANCTAALHLSLAALGAGPGDEVLVADYTYPATGHPVMYTGATPVFVDVRPDTWTIDPQAAASAVSDRTRGIIAVDVFGQCADYEALQALADRHGLFLLEDAAASIGSEYRGRPAGSLADAACFSLHARKGITSGEGGLVTTDDDALAVDVRRRSCFGVEGAYARQADDELPIPVFEVLGYNYKLSDVQAAIALVQLRRLPDLIAARRRVAAHYRQALADLPGVELPIEAEDRTHTWQSFVLTLSPEISRNRVAAALRQHGVQANIGTFASHRQPVYRAPEHCPVSADLFDRHLAIPMHANLTEDQVERVAATLAVVLADRSVAVAI